MFFEAGVLAKNSGTGFNEHVGFRAHSGASPTELRGGISLFIQKE
jgi:hypothetical protein